MKILLSLFLFTNTYAQTYRLNQKSPPTFEAGIGIANANLPAYSGAKERRKLTLPFPSFVYRGDTLRADEDGGLRGRLFKSDRVEINTSFSFSFPVDSENIEAREGMDDLDALFEVGPGVIIKLIPKKENSRFTLSLNLATRAAFTTDLNLTRAQGVSLNPLLFAWTQLSDKTTMFNGLSVNFASQKLHAHFYDVAPQFATATRSQYTSEAGFFSTNLSTFFIFNTDSRWSFFTGAFYENHKGAANTDSPLHLRDENFSTIVGMTYWFYRSK